MIRRSIRPLFAAACVLAGGTLALAQNEISLKPVLRTGEEFSYSFGMVLNVEQQLEAQAAQLTQLRASAQIRMKVVEASPDGSAKLEGYFEQAAVEAPIVDQPFGFEWPTAAPLPDDAPRIRKLGSALQNSILHIEVDPKGNVTVTGGLEKFSKAAEEIDAPDDRYLGFFTEPKLAAVLTPIFKMDGAWNAPRSVGKGWQHSEIIALPPAAALETTADLMLNLADSDIAECGGDVILTLRRPENPSDDIAQVALNPESQGAIAFTFDRRRFLLQRRKMTLALGTDWSLGGTKMSQRQLSVLNIRLVEE